MKRKANKLKLNRETIRDLRFVRGGDEIPPGTGGCSNACQSARCPIPGSVGCISDDCASGPCTASKGPFNCNERTSSIDIPCTY